MCVLVHVDGEECVDVCVRVGEGGGCGCVCVSFLCDIKIIEVEM